MAIKTIDQCVYKHGTCQTHPDIPHCLKCSIPWFYHDYTEVSTDTTSVIAGEEPSSQCTRFHPYVRYYGYRNSVSFDSKVVYPEPPGLPHLHFRERFLSRFDGKDSEWPINLILYGLDQSAYNVIYWFAKTLRTVDRKLVIRHYDPFGLITEFTEKLDSRYDRNIDRGLPPYKAREVWCSLVSMLLLKVKLLLDLMELQMLCNLLRDFEQRLPPMLIIMICKEILRSPLNFRNSDIMASQDHSGLIAKLAKQVVQLFKSGMEYNGAMWTEILFDETTIATSGELDEAHDISGYSVSSWHNIPGALDTLRASIDKYMLSDDPTILYQRLSDSKGGD
jgi:hypothetical protein